MQSIDGKNPPGKQNQRHPFSQAFSPKKLAEDDCNAQRSPTARGSHYVRTTTKTAAAQLLWHERPLPASWTEEEKIIFENWLREAVKLQNKLVSAAKGRPRMLWRAVGAYTRLKRSLMEVAQAAETQAAQGGAAAGSGEMTTREGSG